MHVQARIARVYTSRPRRRRRSNTALLIMLHDPKLSTVTDRCEIINKVNEISQRLKLCCRNLKPTCVVSSYFMNTLRVVHDMWY